MKVIKHDFQRKDNKSDDPLQNNIINKMELLGKKVEVNQSEIKYSELFLEFIKPFLAEPPDYDDVFDMVDLGVVAWNTGNLHKINPAIFKKYSGSVLDDIKPSPEERKIFNKLVERKVKHFQQYDLFIDDFELQEDGESGAHLTLICQPLEEFMSKALVEDLPYEDEEDYDNDSGFIDRHAIVIRPKQAFKDFQKNLFSQEEEKDQENNVYLVHEMDSNEEVEEWLKSNFKKIFENELWGWNTDKRTWPKPLTWKLFEQWFSYEINSMVYDLEKFRISKD